MALLSRLIFFFMAHPFLPPLETEYQAPFTFVSKRLDIQKNGYFRPGAHVAFDSTLRTSGFLFALPLEELRLLMLVLTFVTPNAGCQPLLLQIADALKLSPAKARARIRPLLAFTWQGVPLVSRTEVAGQFALLPTPALVGFKTAVEDMTYESNAPPPSLPAARREQVITHSRATYARPRAAVESQIARLNGWPEPPFPITSKHHPLKPSMENSMPNHDDLLNEANDEAIVRDQLLRVGLNEEQADSLIERFDLLRIRRQLSWLNFHRGVRNRAGFLIAAVTDDYEPPLALRLLKTREDNPPIKESEAQPDTLESLKAESLEPPPLDVTELE